MKIALVQTFLHWENKEKNLSHFDSILDHCKEAVDLFVLPEMFTTGFTMNSQSLGEPINGRTAEWMLNKASEKNACITGSFISTDGKNYYNTLLWAYPNGTFQFYHKRHLFRMAGEHLHYAAGNKKIICEYKGFRFLPLICYDLRFPVWSRNRFGTDDEYDVLIYVANWPEVRIDAWKKLLYARAVENLSYAIGVNRTGTDGTGKIYNGQSRVVGFKGELLTNAGDKEENIVIMNLDKEELMQFREKFPAYLDADDFLISVK